MGTKPYPRSKLTMQSIPPYQTLLKKYDKRNKSLYLGPQLNQIASCSNDEWVQIIDCLDWNQIKQLTLYKCQVGDVYLEMLNQLALTSLQSLRLCDIKITVKGLDLLISSSLNYLSLQSLVLDGNNIGFSGFQFLLKQSKNLKKINKLSLNNCGIGGKQFQKLLSIKYVLPFQGIKQLFLNDNNIGSQGYKIFSILALNFLQNLSITNTQLNTQGIRHIVKSQFHNLQNLNISNFQQY